MKDFSDDARCFVCGPENPAGLRLSFGFDPQSREIGSEVLFPAHLQGWQGTVHGGLLATVLDETLIKAAAASGHKCVTGEITVRYRQPASTGTPYRVAGKVLEARGKIVTAESRLVDESGRICAQASGKLFKIS